jgi:hypothetical protein
MVDLETLDTRDSAVILSIGAVLFNRTRIISEFYQEVNIDDQLKRGRTISGRTLQFWFDQSPEAQKVFTENDAALRLPGALASLAGWLSKAGEDYEIYSNGATFDLCVLQHAYDQLELPTPWTYRQERCFRTLRSMFPHVVPQAEPKVLHNALDDARAQALHTQLILEQCAITQS